MFHLLVIFKIPGHCLNRIHPPKRLQSENDMYVIFFLILSMETTSESQTEIKFLLTFWIFIFILSHADSRVLSSLECPSNNFFKVASFVYLFWTRACLSTSKLKSWVWLSAVFLLAAQLSRPEFSVFSKTKQKGVALNTLCLSAQNF